ncbi:MAG: M56 family metallopeptidase [Planctomycetaceae bacterium]|nr:M56 family metallopeptidase [Planctomycetaceae bacterium]
MLATLLTALLCNLVVMALLAAFVAGLSLFPVVRRYPVLRHSLWVIVLLKVVTPPLIPVPVLPAIEDRIDVGVAETILYQPAMSRRSPVEGMAESNPLKVSSAASTAQHRFDCVLWPLVALSVSGTLLLLALAWKQVIGLRRALRHGDSNDERLRRLVDRSARRMGLATPPMICVVTTNISPLLWVRSNGPVIVIPSSLIEQLSDERLGCVIAHELAHYVRRDHWTNLLALAVAAVCWWNPVVWWVRRELRVTQELCCDALVIGGKHATRRDYAAALFQVLEFTQAERALVPALASAFGGRTSIRRRFEMIADVRLNHRLSWWNYPLLLAGFALLPCLPVSAWGKELKLADCPKAVQKSVRNELSGGRIVDIEKISQEGQVIFEVDLLIDDDEYELHFSPQGKLLAKVLEPAQPAGKGKSDKEDADDDEEDSDDGDDEDEDEDEDDEDDKGKVVLKLSDLPKSVRKTLLRELRGGGSLEELEREIEDGRIIYSAEIEVDSDSGELVYDVEIAENGVLLKKVLEDDDDDEEDEDDDRD